MDRSSPSIPILKSITEAGPRKAWLCDVWGVLHDGVKAFPEAVQACRTFRAQGGRVVLISNSPRPGEGVLLNLAAAGVPKTCFDSLVTSGDVTRLEIEKQRGEPVYHLGPARDAGLFEGLSLRFAPLKEASVVVCTGFVDEEREAVADYEGLLEDMAARGVLMICANPDIVVERGERLLPCAGALAVRYETMGQKVIQAGKPYRPIYNAALALAGPVSGSKDILAIGGAAGLDLDAIYIASRVAIRTKNARHSLNQATLASLFENRPFRPLAAMERLSW